MTVAGPYRGLGARRDRRGRLPAEQVPTIAAWPSGKRAAIAAIERTIQQLIDTPDRLSGDPDEEAEEYVAADDLGEADTAPRWG